MRVAALKQKLIILGQNEVQSLPSAFLAEWNILSITGRANKMPLALPGARSVCSLYFDDVEQDAPQLDLFAATETDILKAIAFAREIGGNPLLIHCYAGISRSTAMAWLIVWQKLKAEPNAVGLAFDIIRTVRPTLLPNRHILKLGVQVLAPKESHGQLMRHFQASLTKLDYQVPEL